MNETSSLCIETSNSTLSDNNNFLNFISNPLFYGCTIVFIILLLCILFLFLIINRKSNSYSKTSVSHRVSIFEIKHAAIKKAKKYVVFLYNK